MSALGSQEDLAEIRLVGGEVQRVGDGRARAHASFVGEPLASCPSCVESRGRSRRRVRPGTRQSPNAREGRRARRAVPRFSRCASMVGRGREPASARGRWPRTGQPCNSRRASRARPRRRFRGLEHRAQIVHSCLQRGELAALVGDAGAALVVEDQPERAREPFIELAPVRMLPAVDEVGRVIRHENQVGRGIADDLVGDRDAAIPDVPDIRAHGDKCPKIRRAAGAEFPSCIRGESRPHGTRRNHRSDHRWGSSSARSGAFSIRALTRWGSS